jgi:predicted Zn-dependent protease with MMP-like domain
MTDWTAQQAPSLAEMEAMAHEALARLPDGFKALCRGVVIRVEDFPDDETLRDMECESPFDLLGLFRGTGLAQGAATFQTGQFPNMVWLYRRPILDYWAEHEETLGHLVTHVLVHEIGHHFGLSDDDMEAIEAAAEDS